MIELDDIRIVERFSELAARSAQIFDPTPWQFFRQNNCESLRLGRNLRCAPRRGLMSAPAEVVVASASNPVAPPEVTRIKNVVALLVYCRVEEEHTAPAGIPLAVSVPV